MGLADGEVLVDGRPDLYRTRFESRFCSEDYFRVLSVRVIFRAIGIMLAKANKAKPHCGGHNFLKTESGITALSSMACRQPPNQYDR